jgi:DNA polymerase III gamma/tau subunit
MKKKVVRTGFLPEVPSESEDDQPSKLLQQSKEKATELYRKYRPSLLDEIIGQDEVVGMLKVMIKNKRVPHCVLASGPSGTGKTTTFRILRNVLGCSDVDFREINAADFRGIDVIREIRQVVGLRPIGGKCKVWLVDEAHQITSQGQEGFLKLLEDTPSHVYFFLASTDPQKLKKTIITRSTHLIFRLLSESELTSVVSTVYKSEKDQNISQSISKKIAELSDGSARKALVLLHQIIDIEDEDDAVELLQSTSVERQAVEICRALLNPRTKWYDMATILKEVEEEAEGIRWMVLGYMKKVALSGGKTSSRACQIINEFRDNFYDSKEAGLVVACYNCLRE